MQTNAAVAEPMVEKMKKRNETCRNRCSRMQES